jgi:hypothetical protein
METEHNPSDFAKKAGDFIEEILNLSIDAGKKGIDYLQCINNVVVMKLEPDTLAILDKIVSAGLAKNRSDAIQKFLDYGLEFRKDIIEKINLTEAEISQLKEQIQTMSSQTVSHS